MGFLWVLGPKKDVSKGFVSISLHFLVLLAFLVLIVSWFGTVRVRFVLPHVFDETWR